MSSTQRLGTLQVLVGCKVHALALDGLDKKRRDVARAKLTFERIEIAERNARTLGQEIAESLAKPVLAVESE